jgi:hypothetical protein
VSTFPEEKALLEEVLLLYEVFRLILEQILSKEVLFFQEFSMEPPDLFDQVYYLFVLVRVYPEDSLKNFAVLCE